MRIPKNFGVRPKKEKEENKRYFLICEGTKTEIRYFKGVKESKNLIGIHRAIEIIPTNRNEEDIGISNPYVILFELCNNMEDYIKKVAYKHYDKEIDKISFIFDRDSKSFKENQFDEVKKECEDKKYNLYISNPYFELWLLFHFDISDLDCDKIKKDEKVDGKYFIKETLKIKNNGYNSSKLNFNDFCDKITTAIENSKKFSTNIEDLKNNKGTNIGFLFEEWIK